MGRLADEDLMVRSQAALVVRGNGTICAISRLFAKQVPRER